MADTDTSTSPPAQTASPPTPQPISSPAPPTPNKPRVIIKAESISQEFQAGDEIIRPIKSASFELFESSFNVIFGPSGSGKSTLLNILTGLQKPTTGTVTFDGNNVYELLPDELAFFRATRLGIVYQNNYWVKSLNSIENVSLPLFFLGYSKKRAAEVAQFALEQVKMGDYGKKYPVLLSGGEQQRIAVARAIASSPLYIIADEPTGSLDSGNGDMIMQLLHDAQVQNSRTIIMVTHNMEYLPLADHLLHIEDGEIQELQNDDIRKTTEDLLHKMEDRIHRLAETKKEGK